MRIIRKTLAVITLATAIALGILWVSAGLWIRLQSPTWISKKLRREHGIDVQIHRVETNYLNAVTYRDIVIAKPLTATIESLRIAVRPWGLLRGQYANVFFVEINRLNAKGPLLSDAQERHFSAQLAPIPVNVLFSDSEIQWDVDKHPLIFSAIEGELKLTKTTAKGHLSAKEKNWGRGHAIVRVNTQTGTWSAELKSDALNSRAIADWVDPKFGSVSGPVAAHLQTNGKWPISSPWHPKWTLDLNSPKLFWRREPNATPVPFSIETQIDQAGMEIRSLRLKDFGTLKGSIDFRPRPFLHLTANVTNGDIERLRDLLPIAGLENVSGQMSLAAKIDGDPHSPDVAASFNVRSQVRALVLPPWEGKFSASAKTFALTSDFSDGTLEASGGWARGLQLNVGLKNISLDRVAARNGWANVHGSWSSDVKLEVLDKNLVVSGPFNLRQLRWGRTKGKDLIAGKIQINKGGIKLDTNDKSLQLALQLNKTTANVSLFKVDFGAESSLTASGSVGLTGSDLDLQLTAKNVPPDIWPPLVARYPSITGHVDLNGSLRGTRQNPNAELKATFADVKFIPSGQLWSGETDITYSNTALAFTDCKINGGYRGEISRSHVGGAGRWIANVVLDHADPRLLIDLARSSATTKGEINGQLVAQVEGSTAVGSSSFTWTQGEVGAVAFDDFSVQTRLASEGIRIVDMHLLRGSQAIHGNGLVSLRKGQWKYDAELQAEQWAAGQVLTDGEVTVKGSYVPSDRHLSASIASESFWIDGYPIHSLSAIIDQLGDSVSASGRSADGLSFKFSRGLSGKINGVFSANNLQIEELVQSFLPSWDPTDLPRGKMNATLLASGSMEQPKLTARLKTVGATWHDEAIDSAMVLAIDRSSVTVVSSELKLKSGGTAYAQGSMSLAQGHFAHFEGAGSEINLQSVFHLMNWPVTWDGKTNAKFVFDGEQDARRLTLIVDGHHTGYGPFGQGGNIQGQIVWEKGEWDLNGLQVASGSGFVKLQSGSKVFVEKNRSGRMHIVADTRNLQTGVLTFFGGVELTGAWKAAATADSERPPVELDVFARNLWINQFFLDGNVSHLTLKKGRVEFSPIVNSGQQISGALDYQNFPYLNLENLTFTDNGQERLFVNGAVGKPKWDFLIRAKQVDASVVRALLDTTVPITGPMDLQLQGKGSLKDPVIFGHATWSQGLFGPLPVDEAACDLQLKWGTMTVKNITASRKKGYQLKGMIAFDTALKEEENRRPPVMDLAIEKGDAAILSQIWSEASHAKGSFDGRLKIADEKGARVVSGYLNLDDVQFQSSSYVPSLRHGKLHLRLIQDKLVVVEGRADLREGTLQFSGDVTFENVEPAFYNLKLATISKRGPTIRVPELTIEPGTVLGHVGIFKRRLAGVSQGEPIINLSLIGQASNPTLAGTIELQNTVFTYPPKEGNGSGESNVAMQWLHDLRNRINWDITLIAGDRTRFENELVSAGVTGQIHISGETGDLSVDGKVNSSEGSIVYSGNEFKINEAVLEIVTSKPNLEKSDRSETLVYLKANAEKDVFYNDSIGDNFEDTIVMDVNRSLLGEIQPRFYSKNNPNISPEKALKLALGLDADIAGDANGFITEQARAQRQTDINQALRIGLVQLLDTNLASPLARALARQTGLVDYIRVSYQQQDSIVEGRDTASLADSSNNNASQNDFLRYMKGTKVRLGRELSNRLFADYSFKVDEFQNQLDLRHEVELAYRLHRNLFLRATSELDSERTLGRPPDRRAILENRWRFGLPKKKPSANLPPAPAASPSPPVVKG